MAELATITGLHFQSVVGPANIEVAWGNIPINAAIGEASVEAVGATMFHASVIISPAGSRYLATLVRHELGHALGLGHAQGPDEVMYPYVNTRSPTDYDAGDLAGLRAVGPPASGC